MPVRASSETRRLTAGFKVGQFRPPVRGCSLLPGWFPSAPSGPRHTHVWGLPGSWSCVRAASRPTVAQAIRGSGPRWPCPPVLWFLWPLPGPPGEGSAPRGLSQACSEPSDLRALVVGVSCSLALGFDLRGALGHGPSCRIWQPPFSLPSGCPPHLAPSSRTGTSEPGGPETKSLPRHSEVENIYKMLKFSLC